MLSSPDSTNQIKRIPIWFMVGTLNEIFIAPPFTEIPFADDSILLYLQKRLLRIRTCLGLTQNFTKKETSITHSYLFTKSLVGQTSKPYILTLIKGMTHKYPTGKNFPLMLQTYFGNSFNNLQHIIRKIKRPKNLQFRFIQILAIMKCRSLLIQEMNLINGAFTMFMAEF
ncbi:MAG: hypothetical protein ABI851_08850 [Saprospiraceae bacterium]